MFAEGWAVYVTQVMMDLGYGADDPALMLNHWKFYLRAVTNAILDVEIHAEGMTEEEAMDLMVAAASRSRTRRAPSGCGRGSRPPSFPPTTWARSGCGTWRWRRGSRAAVAAGAGEDAVPAQRVVGGLGETPGFDYRRHLESVISHGTPPIKWVRRILAEEAEAGSAGATA